MNFLNQCSNIITSYSSTVKQTLCNTDLSNDSAFLSVNSIIENLLAKLSKSHSKEKPELALLANLRSLISFYYMKQNGYFNKPGLADMLTQRQSIISEQLNSLKSEIGPNNLLETNLIGVSQHKNTVNRIGITQVLKRLHQPSDETNRCQLLKQEIDEGLVEPCGATHDLGVDKEFWTKLEVLLEKIYVNVSDKLPVKPLCLLDLYESLLFEISIPLYPKQYLLASEQADSLQVLSKCLTQLRSELTEMSQLKSLLNKAQAKEDILKRFTDYISLLTSLGSELAGLANYLKTAEF